MADNDTVRLLRECDAGVKMGIRAVDEVIDYVSDEQLRIYLSECKSRHESVQIEIEELLNGCHDAGKEPSPMARGMSWVKTNVKLKADESDATVADLITDGCNMGVKALNGYLNRFKAADASSRDMAKKLILLEEEMTVEMRKYL